MVFEVIDLPNNNQSHTIRSVKFITGRQWFVAGDASGLVHVYAYATRDKVKVFESHSGTVLSSLAVHPTDPLLLTASSSDKSIKLWDWGRDWTCTRVFENMDDTVWHLMFGPRGTNTFTSVSSHSRDVKVRLFASSICKKKGFQGINPRVRLIDPDLGIRVFFSTCNIKSLVSSIPCSSTPLTKKLCDDYSSYVGQECGCSSYYSLFQNVGQDWGRNFSNQFIENNGVVSAIYQISFTN